MEYEVVTPVSGRTVMVRGRSPGEIVDVVKQMEKMSLSSGVELWCGTRRVGAALPRNNCILRAKLVDALPGGKGG
jgi:hypothetical protein